MSSLSDLSDPSGFLRSSRCELVVHGPSGGPETSLVGPAPSWLNQNPGPPPPRNLIKTPTLHCRNTAAPTTLLAKGRNASPCLRSHEIIGASGITTASSIGPRAITSSASSRRRSRCPRALALGAIRPCGTWREQVGLVHVPKFEQLAAGSATIWIDLSSASAAEKGSARREIRPLRSVLLYALQKQKRCQA
jgi:hypothetical protein